MTHSDRQPGKGLQFVFLLVWPVRPGRIEGSRWILAALRGEFRQYTLDVEY